MKELILLVIVCFIITSAQSQRVTRSNDINTRNRILDDYKDYHEEGVFVDDKKHGLWQDIGADSTIYVSGEYDMGIQVGTWRINYPDGRIRYTVKYDSLGWPVEWCRYYYSQKIVSIERSEGFDDQIFGAIQIMENTIFRAELQQYESNVYRTSSYNSKGYAYRYYDCDVPALCERFAHLVKQADEEYRVIKYNYPNGLITLDCIVGHDAIISKKAYLYKGKKLKKVHYFEYGRMMSTETYDKEGTVVKVKMY